MMQRRKIFLTCVQSRLKSEMVQFTINGLANPINKDNAAVKMFTPASGTEPPQKQSPALTKRCAANIPKPSSAVLGQVRQIAFAT
jgi:hypothetical protein